MLSPTILKLDIKSNFCSFLNISNGFGGGGGVALVMCLLEEKKSLLLT